MSSVAVHHVVTGRSDGPAVVFSNSLGSTHRMWDPQLAAFEERFRVVRYDTRGHGQSPVPEGPYTIDDLADDVVALLDTLGIERAHVVGLSLGGMTAMRLSARNPQRVDRIALLCTATHMPPSSAWTERAAAVRTHGSAAVAESVVGRWFTPGFLAADPGRKAAYQQMIAATPAEGYAGCCEAIAALDLRADLARITAPTLAIAGTDDPATPPDRLAEITAAVRGARLVQVTPGAHLANVEQADAITPTLLEHLGTEQS